MKIKSFLRTIVLAAFAVLTIVSCQRKEIEVSFEYAPYISAYTGGIISSNATIRIEMTNEQSGIEVGKEINEKLFSFKPALKGKAYWTNNKVIEFIPDSGALKPGTIYQCRFKLGKVVNNVERKLRNFDFSFRVQDRCFMAEITDMKVSDGAPDLVSVFGQISFSEPVTITDVKKMLSAHYNNRKADALISATDDPLVYNFVYVDIAKGDQPRTLCITVDGDPAKIDQEDQLEAEIPALGAFQLYSAKFIQEPESGIRLTFTEPLDANSDLSDYLSIKQAPVYVVQQEDNIADIFFNIPNDLTSVDITLHEGLKSNTGHLLTETVTRKVDIQPIFPAVRILSTGNILPDAQQLLLPFQTAALRAVNVEIIKIYEDNVLMFLQANTLNGTDGLKRAGKLVYKKKLLLNEHTANHWTNYSIDLSKLIKQEPGAIYRVILSFNQSDAIAPFNGETEETANTSEGMVSVLNGKISEEESNKWNYKAYDWYDEDDIDWYVYDWRERNNPYHPSYYMISDHRAATNILASNIGLIVKANNDNNYWIAATNIVTAKPQSGVLVTLYDFQLRPVGHALTDNKGFAFITTKGTPFVAVGSKGREKSYLRIVEGENNSVSRFDVGGDKPVKGLKGFIYGERGVWRPGDTLHITCILEDRGNKIPDNYPVSLELYNPNGQYVYKTVSTHNENGFYTFHVPTAATAPTGFWNAYIKAGSATFHKSIRIETIKPNRLKIDLHLENEKLEASETPVTATLTAAWLSGATARNLHASVEATLTKVNMQFKEWEDYSFHNPATSFKSSQSTLFDGRLNEQGNATFQFMIPNSQSLPGLVNAQFTCRVFETGGDISIYSKTVPVSPFQRYVGVDLKNTSSSIHVITINSDGKPVNANNLEYKIYKTNWSWWWENDDRDFSSYINNTSIEPIATGNLNTRQGKATIPIKQLQIEPGQYLVYIKDTEGGHASGGIAWIGYYDDYQNSNSDNPSGVKMLTFSTDKEEYEVGETASIFLPGGHNGMALISVENGSRVIHREWYPVLDNKGPFRLKITEDMAPNAYLHITLLQPHSQTVNDLPIRMYGVKPIFVTNKASILNPVITAPNSIRPEAKFAVKVKEKNGQPMTYTLAIVDDGLLDLTNFKTPQPWDYFYAREALGIRTWDMFDYVIGSFTGRYGSLFSIGGDQQLNEAKNRTNRFKPVVKFLGPFTLKKGEEKSHNIQLPPYIGSVRVMVVAGNNGSYGNAEKNIEVKAPLMILSSLPRVISTREEIDLPVNVFAMEKNVKNATVTVSTTGKLAIEGAKSKSVTFNSIGDKMVYFKLRSSATTGTETITITANGSGNTSKEVVHIEIRNPNPPATLSETRLVAAGQQVEIPYHFGNGSSNRKLTLEASTIPAADLSRRMEFLYNYSHRCTEQITSVAYPLLYVDQLKELSKAESELNSKNIKNAISSLYGRQLTNGGFAYWDGFRTANEWLSSYVGCFLVSAKEKGYDVHATVLNKWKAYQKKQAQNWRTTQKNANGRYYYYQSDLEQAYRLYSLALANAPEYGAMNRLKEYKELSLQAKWCLAAAYALCGKQQVAQALINKQPTSIAGYNASNTTFGSSLRDEAMILQTLLLMNKEKEAFEQARRISTKLQNENYFETQSTAFALVAMGKMAAKSSKGMQFAWSQQGQSHEVNSAKSMFQQALSVRQANGNIVIKNKGNGSLYVALTSQSQPDEDLTPATNRNIKLEVTYNHSGGSGSSITQVQKGTDLTAVIKVTNLSPNTDYTDVALTHIIPSGWEIYNERLFSDSPNNSNNQFLHQDIRDDRILTYFDLPRNSTRTFKVRLQAAYGGDFILPAILCEPMYNRDAYARTAAGRVKVTD